MKQPRVFQMLTLALCLSVAGAVVPAARSPKPTDANAQDPKEKVVETKSEVSRGGRGAADPNIKRGTPRENDPKAAVPAPPNKGGEKPRGAQATCDVRFDNNTSWWIHVAVDGDYDGLMRPWGDIYTWAIAGPTRLYAWAEFTDGSRKTWGPVTVSCPAGGSYRWKLWP